MADKVEIKQERFSANPFIYMACVLAVLGTIPSLLLWTTEVAYMVGKWYLNFLLISSLLIWLTVFGIWKMKKWAVIAYTIIIIVTQIVLFKYNAMWGYTSLILPTFVTLPIWFYFRKMTWRDLYNFSQQKYLQKQGWTMLHQQCARINSGSCSTFNFQL